MILSMSVMNLVSFLKRYLLVVAVLRFVNRASKNSGNLIERKNCWPSINDLNVETLKNESNDTTKISKWKNKTWRFFARAPIRNTCSANQSDMLTKEMKSEKSRNKSRRAHTLCSTDRKSITELKKYSAPGFDTT